MVIGESRNVCKNWFRVSSCFAPCAHVIDTFRYPIKTHVCFEDVRREQFGHRDTYVYILHCGKQDCETRHNTALTWVLPVGCVIYRRYVCALVGKKGKRDKSYSKYGMGYPV